MLAKCLLPRLDALLDNRNTSELFRFLDNPKTKDVFRSASIEDLEELLIRLAEATELGYPDVNLVQQLVDKLPKARRHGFAACLSYGVLSARKGKARAAHFFRAALSTKSMIPVQHVAFVRYCLSNVCRKRGDYKSALREIQIARRLVSKWPAIEADFSVAEAWLWLQFNDPANAISMYDRAEAVLQKANDDRRAADIESARGRVEQRAGRIASANRHFETSLTLFNNCPISHRGRGRTLINLAKGELLQARQNRLGMDDLDRRTVIARCGSSGITLQAVEDFLRQHGRDRISLQELALLSSLEDRAFKRHSKQREALAQERAALIENATAHLDAAKQLYEGYPDRYSLRGRGRERIIRGYLYVETSDWGSALESATVAYDIGSLYNNRILQTRAKIIETMVYVHQAWGLSEHSAALAQRAVASGERAIELSTDLQEARIRVKAFTWAGFSYLLESPPRLHGARSALHAIEPLLFGMPNDSVTEDAEHFMRRYKQLAMQELQYTSRLVELFDRELLWSHTQQLLREFKIELELHKSDGNVAAVARKLGLNRTRDIDPVKKRLRIEDEASKQTLDRAPESCSIEP